MSECIGNINTFQYMDIKRVQCACDEPSQDTSHALYYASISRWRIGVGATQFLNDDADDDRAGMTGRPGNKEGLRLTAQP